MKRRDFVVHSVSLVMGTLVLGLAPGCRPTQVTLDLAALLSPEVAPLGRRYREIHKPGRNPNRLAEHVLQAAGEGSAAAIARRIREEYAQGETVRVDGWVLSVTACRLAAVVDMVAS